MTNNKNEKLGLKNMVSLALNGYTLSDIKELVALSERVAVEVEPEPAERTEPAEPDEQAEPDTPDEPAVPDAPDEKDKKIKELEEMIKSIRRDNVNTNIEVDKQKTDTEIIDEIVNLFY